jgi:hypothetical protein
MKKEAITVIQNLIGEFQERRKTVTDEVLEKFTAIRKLEFDF